MERQKTETGAARPAGAARDAQGPAGAGVAGAEKSAGAFNNYLRGLDAWT